MLYDLPICNHKLHFSSISRGTDLSYRPSQKLLSTGENMSELGKSTNILPTNTFLPN